jgi:hypothetical protein
LSSSANYSHLATTAAETVAAKTMAAMATASDSRLMEEEKEKPFGYNKEGCEQAFANKRTLDIHYEIHALDVLREAAVKRLHEAMKK